MPLVRLGEWTPDQAELGAGAIEALNVIPTADGYRSFPRYNAVSTTPLVGKCQGAGSFRSSSGAIGQYCGDGAKLYVLVGTVWTDASKMGGYNTDPAGRWVFVSFGSLVLATNGVDPIQKITIDGGTQFEDLGGSPPVCSFLAVCKDYVVAAKLATDVTAVQWCATADPENWPTDGTGGGDIQPCPDGGQMTGVTADDFFLAKLERAIQRFDFIGGDLTFARRQIGFGIGAAIAGTVQAFNDRSFFYHETGFYQCISGSAPIPIGVERVNRYFAKRLTSGARNYVFSAIDPVSSLYVVGFNTDGAPGYPITELMIYKWDLGQNGEWSHVISGMPYEIMFSGLSAVNVTMEDLDIYGSMEAVPFPLDSLVWLGEGNQLFGGFSADHNSGWFNGTAMDATLTTTEAILNDGQKSLLRGYRPQVQSSGSITVTGTVYARDRLTDPPATNPNSMGKIANDNGLVRARIKGRYHRATLFITGDSWDQVLGIDDVIAVPLGNR